MDEKYKILSEESDNKHPDFLRKDSDQNVDQLIIKPNLLTYIDRNVATRVEQDGLMSPEYLLAKYPKYVKEIKNIYKEQLEDPTLKRSVTAFFCRMPDKIERCRSFLKKNVPVKIVVEKLLKADGDYKMYMIKHPNRINELIPLDKDRILELCQKEEEWFEHFKSSKDPYFNDVPRVAIWSKTGVIPAFACKILKDSNKKLVS